MRSIPKLIRRFLAILLLSVILLFLLNIIVLFSISMRQTPGASAWTTAAETGAALTKTADGNDYILAEDTASELIREEVWGILIDNDTHQVVWHTDNLPPEIPRHYSLADIASLTRGYVMNYPAFTGQHTDGLIVLGYPQDRYWKHMYPNWDYYFIANLPKIILNVLIVNAALIFMIYLIASTNLMRSVRPIAEGIQALPTKEPVYVREKGVLSELAAAINQTSEILKSQNYQLRKRESARANWIAGVSHDIRTPLSMVLGYAAQLTDNPQLDEDARQKTRVIIRQSERIRNLINDLNLASKLEYDMQPIRRTRENAVAIARQIVVDFMNMDIDGKYPIEWKTKPQLTACYVNADKDLLKRAVSNLIQNCINHNPDGCTIYISVQENPENSQSAAKEQQSEQPGVTTCTIQRPDCTGTSPCCIIRVEDDGAGISEEELQRLNNTPHYMMCDSSTLEQRHGLGLLLVRQIAASHDGRISLHPSIYGGFGADILLPV